MATRANQVARVVRQLEVLEFWILLRIFLVLLTVLFIPPLLNAGIEVRRSTQGTYAIRRSKAARTPEDRQKRAEWFSHMIREEAFSSLFHGVRANSTRSVLANSSQLASSEFFKSLCLSSFYMSHTLTTRFCAFLAARFATTTICSPGGVVKSRIMSSVGFKEHVLKIIRDAARKEALLWMFRVWLPSFTRLGPQTILLWRSSSNTRDGTDNGKAFRSRPSPKRKARKLKSVR